eukprot:scaffold682_cov363-Pavlova_lutheri.AAC.64
MLRITIRKPHSPARRQEAITSAAIATSNAHDQRPPHVSSHSLGHPRANPSKRRREIEREAFYWNRSWGMEASKKDENNSHRGKNRTRSVESDRTQVGVSSRCWDHGPSPWFRR